MKGLRVLIVDDNVDSAEMLGTLLGLAGHDTRCAFDGAAALAAAGEFVPDAVLIDIGLPDMDGYELARRMRQEPALASALLVATTGYSTEEDKRRAREAGIDRHVTKPLELGQIERMLSEWDRAEA
jgi:two-component system, sensor histidine kinase